ncbi:MAG: SMC-Scp complex subunit ScpB [Cellvibrionaceae bacterium]
MEPEKLRLIIESALMAYGQPLSIEKLQSLFVEDIRTQSEDDEEERTVADVPSKQEIEDAIEIIQQSCEDRGFELKKVSSGWRFQVRVEMAQWVNKLWEEKPQRYSRALLETLSIIAYRQPITRGDIEEIRGVAVSSHIIKTLSEREWVKVVGQRDVPGRPSLYATTRQFLDYFNLESLEELPSLRELADIDSLTPELDLQPEEGTSESEDESGQAEQEKDAGEVLVSEDNIDDHNEASEDQLADDQVEHTENASEEMPDDTSEDINNFEPTTGSQ